jgi:peptidoglycan/LPS O-acetylase OafA/YrhL
MLVNVQMLRALAAFAVVLVHVEPLAVRAGLPERSLHFGTTGVDLFFVISGMIMVVTTADGRQTPLGFLRNRLTRIAPLYWSITLLVFAMALLSPALLQSTTADPVHLLKSLAFVPYVRPSGDVNPIVFVGWSLNYEMMFYLLFALGLLWRRRWAGVAATGLVLVASVFAALWLKPSDPVLGFYSQPMVLEFAAGMALGLLLPRLRFGRRWRWAAAAAGATAFGLMLASSALWPGQRIWAVPVLATAVVAAAVAAERGGLAVRQGWILLLGAASYAVYLTHFFCTQTVIKAAERLSLGPALSVALIPATFVVVGVVGVMTHRALELPLTKLARRALAPARSRDRISDAARSWQGTPEG